MKRLFNRCVIIEFCCVPSPPQALWLSAHQRKMRLWTCPQFQSSVLCHALVSQIASDFKPTLSFFFPNSSRVCSCCLFLGHSGSLPYFLGIFSVFAGEHIHFLPSRMHFCLRQGLLDPLVLKQHFKYALWLYFDLLSTHTPFHRIPPTAQSELQIKVCYLSRVQSLFSIVVLLKTQCAHKSQGEVGESGF